MREVGVVVAGVLNFAAIVIVGGVSAHTRRMLRDEVAPKVREIDHAVNDKPASAATIGETVDDIHRVVTDPRASPLARQIHEEHGELEDRLKGTSAPRDEP